MDEHLLRVGEFLRRTRLSAKALRLYGAQGLLAPVRVDGRTGYRWYAPAQVERARLIGLLRRAGMPLARVRAVVDLPAADRTAAVERWWAGVEDDLARRRLLVTHLLRRAPGGTDPSPEDPVPHVALRTTGEHKLLTAERRLTVEELDGFITTARQAIEEHLTASGAARAGALRVVYHGMVTEDSDGPVEVAVPFTGSVEPVADLRVRLQPAGREAVTALTRDQAEFPRILDAYDAVARWCDAAGLERTGSPAEVYLTGRDVEPATVHLEVAWPVG
ncbi:MerR family transcriptional regulator [Geodermatophilus sp. CPCC 206100]|uniref:MerR family transcriptional regulator n=1 Tax=Geodermatophilus sp. CPCC 206100 TaxID=3020054 RepID=UPI003B001B9D